MIHISDIQEMISSFKQGEFTVTNYFTQLKILWDELDLLCPLSTCSYASKCTCNSLVNVSKYKAQDQIIKFLSHISNKCIDVDKSIMSVLLLKLNRFNNNIFVRQVFTDSVVRIKGSITHFIPIVILSTTFQLLNISISTTIFLLVH